MSRPTSDQMPLGIRIRPSMRAKPCSPTRPKGPSPRSSAPKRPKQLPLTLKPPKKHGGRRDGAGRPRNPSRVPHTTRKPFAARHPLHINIKLRPGLPSLRRKDLLKQLREAVKRARLKGLAIIHYALLHNHLHLIVETQDERAIARQMQSLGISLAKRINLTQHRKGQVLNDRYHVHILRTPRETRNALVYVLTNERKHAKASVVARDAYTSGSRVAASMWRQLLGPRWNQQLGPERTGGLSLLDLLTHPQSWMLARGWERASSAPAHLRS